jgi:hypothetical protein
MKFYLASSIMNEERVQEAIAALRDGGHHVTVDWTLTEAIGEDERDGRPTQVEALARRDFEGIREADVFVILTEPPDARSMYVELGVALSLYELGGRPLVFAMGGNRSQSIFYYHPAVRGVRDWSEIHKHVDAAPVPESSPDYQVGKLEEFRALRAEMLEIIKDRIWGQATYAVLAAGLIAFALKGPHRETGEVFLIALALPFLMHTMFREDARIRMGNYLRVVLEPRIPGMYWEAYLGLWRAKFGEKDQQGWLTVWDRVKHMFALSGLYLVTSVFSWVLLITASHNAVSIVVGSVLLLILGLIYVAFYRLYDKGQVEYQLLKNLQLR